MFTNIVGRDGFGAQYQRIIQTYIFCKLKKLHFVYRPFQTIEHNYDNNLMYNTMLENMINLKNNIENDEQYLATELDFGTRIRHWFDDNIDNCCKSEHMAFIKNVSGNINLKMYLITIV